MTTLEQLLAGVLFAAVAGCYYYIAKAAGGPNRPLVRTLRDVEITGALDLSFTPSKGRPALCGVEVIAR